MPTSFETAFQSIGAIQDTILGAITATVANFFGYLGNAIIP